MVRKVHERVPSLHHTVSMGEDPSLQPKGRGEEGGEGREL